MFPIPLLYIMTVLIWGTTWYAIKLQVGTISLEVSIAYRFALAAILLVFWCVIAKKRLRFSVKDHGYIALQGLFLFCANYFMAYFATPYLPSGINALVFSSVVVFNTFGAAFVFGKTIHIRGILGAAIGLIGLVLIFIPELENTSIDNVTVKGLLLSLSGTIFASIGNIISMRNYQTGLGITETNAVGMAYGALFSLVIALFMGNSLTFDFSLSYVGSLLYLAIMGSIVAFGCYLTLVNRIGPDKGAYALVLVPIVALLISQVFEAYQWTLLAVAGIMLVLVGNILALFDKKKASSP